MASLALKMFFVNCADCFALLDKTAEKLQPTDEDLEAIEAVILGFLAGNPELRSSNEAFRLFLNVAYSKESGLSPQFPRKDVEAVIQLVQETHPTEWIDLSLHFDLWPFQYKDTGVEFLIP